MLGAFPAFLDPERQTAANHIVGSRIGAQEFMKALARYMPPEPMSLFVQEDIVSRARHDIAAFELNQPGKAANIQVLGMDALPALMQNTSFLAFHDMTGPYLHRQAYARAKFGREQFPATTLIHGISYNYVLWDMAVRMVLAPTQMCDSVICTSRAARDAFSNIITRVVEGLNATGNCKVNPSFRLDIVPLGIDTDLYRPRNKQDCREILGLPHDKTVLLYFGRIDATTKGDLHPLLMTFSELVRKHDNLLLLLAGNVDQGVADRLHGVAKQLRCTAPVLIRKQPGIIEGPLYYGAADIFVSTVETLQESFGLTPLEAMASGLPVVASDWSGYRDTVVHGQTGFLVPTRWADCSLDISLLSPLYDWQHDHLLISQSISVDTGELYHSLDKLIGNVDLRCKFGASAREHVLANFHWQRVVDRTYALWKELRKVADTLPYQRLAAPTPIASDYFQDFCHYATEIIKPTANLHLTESGVLAAKQFPQYLLHANVNPPFNLTALQVMLRFVKAARMFGQTISFDDLAARISSKHPMSQEEAKRHVMLLVKYGFLKL